MNKERQTENKRIHQQGDSLLFGQMILCEGLAGDISLSHRTPNGVTLVGKTESPQSHHHFSVGQVPHARHVLYAYRHKPYWMVPATADQRFRHPPETQFSLIQLSPGFYMLLLPLVSRQFRACLSSSAEGHIDVEVESGSEAVKGDEIPFLRLEVGENPYELIQRGIRHALAHPSFGKLREAKAVPDFLDGLGWCSWNAFYKKVSRSGILSALHSLIDNGIKISWVIIDDGWLSTEADEHGQRRLTGFDTHDDFGGTLAETVAEIKSLGVLRVFVWHTIQGYWGGVDGHKLGYATRQIPAIYSKGVCHHLPGMKDAGPCELIEPEDVARFYLDFYGHLAEAGVDGVKVDNQASLEAYAHATDGRVNLVRRYHEAMEAAALLYFNGRVINCMELSNDVIFQLPASNIIRTSDDFFPEQPETHVLHLYANSISTLFTAPLAWPDWDMFQSPHEWGAYHAAMRALSGGPVYITDEPRKHDLDVLKFLVCENGYVPHPQAPALPAKDCLFANPLKDDVLWKIAAPNRYGWIAGAFHGQYHEQPQQRHYIAGTISPQDLPVKHPESTMFAMYSFSGKRLIRCSATGKISVWLAERRFELVTIVPIQDGFAPIGLIDKYNPAATILHWERRKEGIVLRLACGGPFLAFSDREPLGIYLGDEACPFNYDRREGRLQVNIPGHGECELVIVC
ncbi:MAG: hypothetical protein D6820_09895 [Lentisphaerae bacterium]|nr:MAG: hypothetical protein D6820_09895 [Lentisphaerota bacterium]